MSGAVDLSGWRVLGWRGGAVVAINAKGQERALFRVRDDYRDGLAEYVSFWDCMVCGSVGVEIPRSADAPALKAERRGVEHLMAAHGMADPGELFDAPTAEQRIAHALEQLVKLAQIAQIAQAIQTRAPRGGGW